MRRKIVVVGLLAAAWAGTLALANMLLAPATGAASVLQMDASNASYLASMAFVSGAPMFTVVITGAFALAIFLVSRSKK